MNCKMCSKKEPKYFFRNMISSEFIDVFLCEECYEKVSGGQRVLGIMDDQIVVEGNGITKNSNSVITDLDNFLKCPNCLIDLSEISKTGRFGCENCYDFFSDMIAIAEAKIDEAVKRTKTSIKKEAEESVEEGEMKTLENKLQNAIKTESYELAAKIRDEIKKLKENKVEDGKIIK